MVNYTASVGISCFFLFNQEPFCLKKESSHLNLKSKGSRQPSLSVQQESAKHLFGTQSCALSCLFALVGCFAKNV